MKFSIKDLFSKYEQICRKLADLVTFIEEILNGKLIFCAAFIVFSYFQMKPQLLDIFIDL